MKTQNLSEWAVVMDDRNPFLAPELRRQCLSGKRDDDKTILTSVIVGKAEDGCVVTASGSHYNLLDVLPDYEQHYPDAKNRLLNTLPLVKE